LPGAPVDVEQSPSSTGRTASGASATLSGNPPVLHLAISDIATQSGLQGYRLQSNRRRNVDAEIAFVDAVIGGGSGKGTVGGPAQEAVGAALLHNAGAPKSLDLPSAMADAARRLTALAPSEQRAWLAIHLLALRSGHITLAQIP
jgi:hypothetical protein